MFLWVTSFTELLCIKTLRFALKTNTHLKPKVCIFSSELTAAVVSLMSNFPSFSLKGSSGFG